MSWDDKWKWYGDPEESRDVDLDGVIEMIEAARKEERERFAKMLEEVDSSDYRLNATLARLSARIRSEE